MANKIKLLLIGRKVWYYIDYAGPSRDITTVTGVPRLGEPESTEWLTRKQASLYLTSIGCPLSPQTLANRAANNNKGNGPPYSRIGWNIVRYKRSDLDAWAAKNIDRIE